MQNNYYLIKQLVPNLKAEIIGAKLTDCFSQNKDELVIKFAKTNLELYTIIAHLNPQFTCLAFPDAHRKAKKNAATIFSQLKLLEVVDIKSYLNERAFTICFENNYSLLFKLYGQQSNLVLLENNVVVSIFRSSLKNDYLIDLDKLARPIVQSKEAIMSALPDIKSVYPTLDRQTRGLLEADITHLEREDAYKHIHDFIAKLENPEAFYIIKDDKRIKFSLIATPQQYAEYSSPVEALTQFFRLYLKDNKFLSERNRLMKDFQQQLNKTKAYIKKTKRKKEEIGNKTSYREMADLLMANLHVVEPNTSSVELVDFYTGENIKVKLNSRLSAQKNAEKYYNKGKNVAIEINKLADTLSTKERLLEKLSHNLETLANAQVISDLDRFIKKSKKEESTKSTPFKEFDIDGFTVYVGNNAKQNDLLTLKFAKKEDLFFHAKDVSGSHVILKQISGKHIGSARIETTA